MSENYKQSVKCIVINDKLKGSIAKHLRCDVLLYYKFVVQFAGERIFKIGEHLRHSSEQNGWLFYAPHSPCAFYSKMQNSPDR